MFYGGSLHASIVTYRVVNTVSCPGSIGSRGGCSCSNVVFPTLLPHPTTFVPTLRRLRTAPSTGLGKGPINQLHYYALPWPSETLTQMGEERVRMRITLSYYVQPSPSLAGRNNKYRYPSATLHFDVKRHRRHSCQDIIALKEKNNG